MTLVLEIEYLLGVSFAAVAPDSLVPDWPPQPDRIFSGLVATWAARGCRQHEAEALEWLEALPTPRALVSDAQPRTPSLAFVPPNDARSERQKNAHDVLPAFRNRQPRRFPAARPHDPVVRFFWLDADPEPTTFAALEKLAADTAYIGHSASFTRCRFAVLSDTLDLSDAALPQRGVYPGRFQELLRTFNGGRRPLAGARVPRMTEAHVRPSSVFGERWLLLEHTAGTMPDLRASALVAKIIREALLSGYRRIGNANDIPMVISGHKLDKTPASSPHVAVICLPFVGFPYADGHVMGFALVPPRDSTILDDEEFRKALRALAPIDQDRARRVLTIRTKEGAPSSRSFSIDLSPTFEAPSRSLDPRFYTGPARVFASVTPIALDRHLKGNGEAREAEIRAQLANACRNIGLPEPEELVADKHSAFEGAPSAYPSGKSPDWLRWRLPSFLASRPLTHAVFRFPVPVHGPVIVGAGRFTGLGLCRPLGEER